MEDVDFSSISKPVRVILYSTLAATAAGLFWASVIHYQKGSAQNSRFSLDYHQTQPASNLAYKNSVPVTVASDNLQPGGLETDVLE